MNDVDCLIYFSGLLGIGDSLYFLVVQRKIYVAYMRR